MSECYTIRPLKWTTEGDGFWCSDTGTPRQYIVRPTRNGWTAKTYLNLGTHSEQVGKLHAFFVDAKAACLADWVKRLEPALVRMRGKQKGKS